MAKEAATMTEPKKKPEVKQLTTRIPVELHIRMQVYKAHKGKELQEQVIEAVERLLKEEDF